MDSLRPRKIIPEARPEPIRHENVPTYRPMPLGTVKVAPVSPKRHSRRGRFIAALLLGVILIPLSFLFFKLFFTARSISVENPDRSFFSELTRAAGSLLHKRESLRGEDEGRINILLLGRAGEKYPGRNLTDTVMIGSIDIPGKRVALLSLPRDLFVPLGETGLSTKLNSVYQYGLSSGTGTAAVEESVEIVTGLPIHYTAMIDFDGFEKAIDALGGVRVEVPRDLKDTRYPGKNYSYETFEITKGWHTLDGVTALKYARERHADPEGDFGRAKRQQQILQAVRDQIFSLGTFFNIFTVGRLLDVLGESVTTDLSLSDMSSLLELLRTVDTKNIPTVVVDAWKRESLLRVSHIMTPTGNAFILVPRAGTWNEIHLLAKNMFALDELRLEKDRITSEAPTLLLLATRSTLESAGSLREFFLDLGFTSVRITTENGSAPPETALFGADGTEKLFSHNSLVSRLDLTKRARSDLQTTVPIPEDIDFVLRIGEDRGDLGTLSVGEPSPEETGSPDVFLPQPKTPASTR